MSGLTSLKVGGPADLLAYPVDVDDLLALLTAAHQHGIPVTVVGRGFNTLVRDGGIRGLVVSLARLDGIVPLDPLRLEVGAGAWSMDLARVCRDRGLKGLEFLVGIPGSVGGLLAMNAGAHGSTMLGAVESIDTVLGGERRRYRRAELVFGYRYLRLEPGEIITGAILSLTPESPAAIGRLMEELQEKRAASQNVGFPNAGSFFRNPPGAAAWQLIEEAGLRGAAIGGAQVSEVHANFMVNRGGATATDFIRLMEMVKERVRQQSGIELEEEIRIIGEE
jgi:UDP-N-acetylmuramate dehydrogenase